MNYEILTSQRDQLGEGALWDDRDQTFWWTDILSGAIYQFDPSTGESVTHLIGSHVGTIALRASGGLLLATFNGFVAYDPSTRIQTPLADPEAHLPTNRFNDGKPGPAGEMWAGTIAYDASDGAAALYRLGADGVLECVVKNVTISNGIAWNSAETIFYYIDTPTMQIMAYDYDKATGTIANPRVAVTVPDAAGYPDGMTIDSDDKLWVAHYAGSAVCRWDPATGEQLSIIKLPASQITCCTFGGANFDQLYVTSAYQTLNSAELTQQPNAGALFRIQVNASGRPAYRYGG